MGFGRSSKKRPRRSKSVTAKAALLSAPSSRAACSTRSGLRPERTTLAPSERACLAVSKPIPELPPSTTTVCPASCGSRLMASPQALDSKHRKRTHRCCSFGQLFPRLLAHHVLGVPVRPVGVGFACPLLVFPVRGFRAAQCLRQFTRRRVLRVAGHTTGQSRRDLLKQPAVAVRIMERGKRTVAPMVRIRTADAEPPKKVGLIGTGVLAAGIVEHLTDFDTAIDQLAAGSRYVGDDQVQTLGRTGCRRGDVPSEDDRASRASRRELNHAEVATVVVVGVEPPAEVPVEVLGAINIGDGDDQYLELMSYFRDSRVAGCAFTLGFLLQSCHGISSYASLTLIVRFG